MRVASDNTVEQIARANRDYFLALASTRAELSNLRLLAVLVIVLLGLDTFIGVNALILFEGARRSRVHLDERLERILQALEESRGATVASQNGHKAVPEGFVIVGRSSYHLPGCRLVAGKEDQSVMSVGDAQERGLAPCRVCAPDLVAD